MNMAILMGNLTGNPELKQLPSGTEVCEFRLAVNRRYAAQGGEKVTDFLPVKCWGKLAENCAAYLTKGRKVCVTGEIQTRSYTAQDGSKRVVTEINASQVEFIGGAQDTGERGAAAAQGAAATAQGDMHQMGFTEVDSDTLPF